MMDFMCTPYALSILIVNISKHFESLVTKAIGKPNQKFASPQRITNPELIKE